MKIFLAYGYNPRDQWIKDMVFPIIQSFGSEVVTGEETYEGPNIPENVLAKIRRSDALIGFTTKRAPQDNVVGGRISGLSWSLPPHLLTDDESWRFVSKALIHRWPRQGLQRIDYDEKKGINV
jgi:hypothetical protein